MKTLEDVRAYHLTEAERYLAIGATWSRAAEAVPTRNDGEANAVRRDRMADAGKLAVAIAREHADLAEACSAKPATIAA